MSQANCPICKIPIYDAEIAELPILHCAECEGTAYKRETLMRFQPADKKEVKIGVMEKDHQTPPYFEARDRPPFLVCPFCLKRMEQKRLGQMMADICQECRAVWLEGEKSNHINDMLGPYKAQTMSQAKGRRSRR
jgi:Zn-finger nucleic acid-binding protein